MRTYLICTVWGDAFLKTFLELSLPTQLSKGNIGFVDEDLVYLIYTTKSGEAQIRASEIYQKLRKCIPVEFVNIVVPRDKCIYAMMNDTHKDAITRANSEGAAFMFMTPDMILSENVFSSVFSRVKQGKRLVLMSSLRLDLERFKQCRFETSFPNFTPRELMTVGLKCLHKMVLKQIWDGPKFSGWPSSLYWRLGEKAFLIRAFHLHPLFVKPEASFLPEHSFDVNFAHRVCPDQKKWKVVDDSDEFLILEVSHSSKGNDLGLEKKLSYKVSSWMRQRAPAEGPAFVQTKICFHANDMDKNWNQTYQKSDRLVQKVLQQAQSPGLFTQFIWKSLQVLSHLNRFVHEGKKENSSKGAICFFVLGAVLKRVKEKIQGKKKTLT